MDEREYDKMSKRSLGSKAAQKKGQEIHRKERELHRAKLRRKAEREQEQNGVQPTQ